MSTSSILASLDAEILRLQQARALLSSTEESEPRRRGRPKGSPNKPASGKRALSPEARARIAEAQRTRWAKQKTSSPEAPPKKAGQGKKAGKPSKKQAEVATVE